MKRVAVVCCMLLTGCSKLFGLSEVASKSGDATPQDKRLVQATPAFVEQPNTLLHVPLDHPPAEHDLLVVAIATFRNTLGQVSDSANNTYAATPIYGAHSGLDSTLWIVYSADVNTASPFGIDIATTATDASSSEVSAIALEYSGTFASDPYDTSISSADTGSGVAIAQSCGSVTGTGGVDVYVAALAHDFTGVTQPTGMFSLVAPPLEDSVCCAALAASDRIGPGEATSAAFVSNWDGGTGNPTWVCGLVAFH